MHSLRLTSIKNVTHDTYSLTFPKPSGYTFSAGQATEFALGKEGWTEEKRPFTFTSLPDDDHLEFIIKSYPSHNGVTEQIAKMKPGDTALLDDPWGAIEDRGPGIFIAGGAGITPFIAILRHRLKSSGDLDGYHLIFSNKTEADIILRDEFEGMKGLTTKFLVTDDPSSSLESGRIDQSFLEQNIPDKNSTIYLCGPPPMEEAVGEALHDLGFGSDQIVREEE